MSDVGKKKKNDNLIDEAMLDLASDDPLYQYDDAEKKQFSDANLEGTYEGSYVATDGEAPEGLDVPPGFAKGNLFEPKNKIQAPPEVEPQLEYSPPEYRAPDPEVEKLNYQNENDIKTNMVTETAKENTYRGGESTVGEKTIVVGSGGRVHTPDADFSMQPAKGFVGSSLIGPAMLSPALSNSQVVQAENLKIAQDKISELEQELEKFRAEYESLSSSASFAKEQVTELSEKLQRVENERASSTQQLNSEIAIYKDSLANKDFEINKLRQKVNELDTRLQKDLRKIRVRERELENRLEILKLEKDAALEALRKQNSDLSVKHDQASQESDQLKKQVAVLSEKLNFNHQQMARAVRSLRLTLTSLEVADTSPSSSVVGAVTPIKKAE